MDSGTFERGIQGTSQIRPRIPHLLGEFPSLWKQMTNSSSRPVGLGTARSITHLCLLSWLQPGCSFSSKHPHVVYEETSSRYLLVVRLRNACPDTPSQLQGPELCPRRLRQTPELRLSLHLAICLALAKHLIKHSQSCRWTQSHEWHPHSFLCHQNFLL